MWWCQAALARACSSFAVSASLSPSRSYGLIPMVIEYTSRGERAYDIFSRFLYRRRSAHLYINSPGGVVTAGMAIYDPVHSPRVNASIGSLLLAAGAPGKRRAPPNASIMIDQPSGNISGKATDMAIYVNEILKLRERLIAIYAKHTGQPIQRIEQCMDHKKFMTAEEAKEFGIIDEIIVHRPITLVTDAVVGSSDGGSTGSSGNSSILKLRERLNAIYAKHTGQPIQRIEQCMDHNKFMAAEEAKEFGSSDGGSTGSSGNSSILKLRERVHAIYAKHTGQPIQRIQQSMDRDKFMTAEEAKEFGIVDKIIEHRPTTLVTDVVVGSSDGGSTGSSGNSSSDSEE